MEEYYARRASEYEEIYRRPERQADLQLLREELRAFCRGRRLLEVACGTGYWTAQAAQCGHVCATDAVEQVLAIARAKGLEPERAVFVRADAFALDVVEGDFDAAFAGFWWSHVRRRQLPVFLAGLHRRLGPDREVLFFDNRFVAGSSTPLSRMADGDSFQERRLADGERYEVVKNFPSADEVRDTISRAGGRKPVVRELQYFWLARYEVGPTPSSLPTG